MTVEQNLHMVDAAFEAINERNWDHLWGLHVDNIVMSSPDLPEPVKGREAVQERLQAWGEAPSGSLVDLGARLRTGRLGLRGAPHYGNAQRAAAPWLRPTLLGPESDGVVPPTENRIELRGCVVYKVEGGEISESHVYYDQLEFLKQLGLVR